MKGGYYRPKLRTVSLWIPHFYLQKTLWNAVHFLDLVVFINFGVEREV
jgi:hypothetical protein